jgi:hypothetical protein
LDGCAGEKVCKCWGWADGDDFLPVGVDQLEKLLEHLAARLGVGHVLPEAAEVFEHGTCPVEVGSGAGGEGVQLGVGGVTLSAAQRGNKL